MRRSKSKLLVGILVLTAATLIAFLWDDARVYYELHRLRREPESLRTLVMERNDGITARTVQAYLALPEGRLECVRQFLRPVRQQLAEMSKRDDTIRHSKLAVLGARDDKIAWLVTGPRFNGTGNQNGDGFRSRIAKSHFPALVGREFVVPDYPNHRVRVERVDQAVDAFGTWLRSFKDGRWGDFLLVLAHHELIVAPTDRIVGGWECMIRGSSEYSSIQFRTDGTCRASWLQRDPESQGSSEIVESGRYRLARGLLALTFENRPDHYFQIQFSVPGELFLRDPATGSAWSAYRRHQDVPVSERNTIGIEALQPEPEPEENDE